MKHPRAAKCFDCYHRTWTPEEEAQLRRLIEGGLTHKRIGEILDRSALAVRSRAAAIGAKQCLKVHQRNRIAAVKAFFADPAKVKELKSRPIAPETRAKRSAHARARNLAGTFGVKRTGHKPETCRKMSETRRRMADERLNFAPRGHPLRALYDELIYQHHVGVKEALAIIRGEIERMSPFDRQMLRVQAGAGLTVMHARTAQIGEMPHRDSGIEARRAATPKSDAVEDESPGAAEERQSPNHTEGK